MGQGLGFRVQGFGFRAQGYYSHIIQEKPMDRKVENEVEVGRVQGFRV